MRSCSFPARMSLLTLYGTQPRQSLSHDDVSWQRVNARSPPSIKGASQIPLAVLVSNFLRSIPSFFLRRLVAFCLRYHRLTICLLKARCHVSIWTIDFLSLFSFFFCFFFFFFFCCCCCWLLSCLQTSKQYYNTVCTHTGALLFFFFFDLFRLCMS